MGADCAVDPFGEARRRQAARGYASGDERRDVCAEQRMPVALYPQGLAARSTVNRYFCDWSYDGTLDRIHHALYLQCREKLEREASPAACIVDSQSVKSAEKGGRGLTRMALTRAS